MLTPGYQYTSRDSRQADVVAGEKLNEVEKDGFETSTEIHHDRFLRYIVVAALDKDGEVLGMSNVYDMGDEFAKQVDPEEASLDNDGNSAYSNVGYAGAGAAFGGFLVVAGGASLATFLYFRRRKARSFARETKYAPVMTEERS